MLSLRKNHGNRTVKRSSPGVPAVLKKEERKGSPRTIKEKGGGLRPGLNGRGRGKETFHEPD